MGIIIEKASASDFLAVAALDRLAWSDNNNAQYIPDGEHAWRIWCEHSVMFCAKSRGEVVGAILAFACESESYCVHKVIVCKEHRGLGIGGQLFNALLTALDAKQVSSFLTVDPTNVNAVTLYKKWGYQITEHVNGYYRANEHRYVMTR